MVGFSKGSGGVEGFSQGSGGVEGVAQGSSGVEGLADKELVFDILKPVKRYNNRSRGDVLPFSKKLCSGDHTDLGPDGNALSVLYT